MTYKELVEMLTDQLDLAPNRAKALGLKLAMEASGLDDFIRFARGRLMASQSPIVAMKAILDKIEL